MFLLLLLLRLLSFQPRLKLHLLLLPQLPPRVLLRQLPILPMPLSMLPKALLLLPQLLLLALQSKSFDCMKKAAFGRLFS